MSIPWPGSGCPNMVGSTQYAWNPSQVGTKKVPCTLGEKACWVGNGAKSAIRIGMKWTLPLFDCSRRQTLLACEMAWFHVNQLSLLSFQCVLCAAGKQIYIDRFFFLSIVHCVHCADCEQLLFVAVFLLSLRMRLTNNATFLIILLSLHQQKT